jgi:hypothetical protein
MAFVMSITTWASHSESRTPLFTARPVLAFSTALQLSLILPGCAAPGSEDGDRGTETFDASIVRRDEDSPSSPQCGAAEVSCGSVCIASIEPRGEVIVERVFRGSCAFSGSCHGGAAPKAGIALDRIERVLETAVSQHSSQRAERLIIAPGQPDTSYLLDKLLGHKLGVDPLSGLPGTIMPPPPSSPLCDSKVEAVRRWIEHGAAP